MNDIGGHVEIPLEAVWETELIPLLEREPSLTLITLWDHLAHEQYPGEYPERLPAPCKEAIVKHWASHTRSGDKPRDFSSSMFQTGALTH